MDERQGTNGLGQPAYKIAAYIPVTSEIARDCGWGCSAMPPEPDYVAPKLPLRYRVRSRLLNWRYRFGCWVGGIEDLDDD